MAIDTVPAAADDSAEALPLSEELFSIGAALRILELHLYERTGNDPTGLVEDQRRVIEDCHKRVCRAARRADLQS
jgi:hypothetical protein